ncbi:chloride channel protein [Actinotalea sp.]|uniref:chloride channel protein n=1 Tax=Actinotalea sp. TaxID=1872145 RepID=UPI002B5A364E|nr:chloride channel protein [Actinotalea sp.]HQY33927.1 chloride channel protein [Actinotalea sp.]HRA50596.1 chloride channel protein [Actinotalea sp.]
MTDQPDASATPAATPVGTGAPRAGAVAPAPARVRTARLLALAALLGGVVSVVAYVFVVLVHEATHLVWVALPGLWGADEPPAWWVVTVLVVGAAAVHGAVRLPGHGGHHPLDGLAFDIGPRALGSTLLAALATLVAGAVVGPEAPLLAIGTALALTVSTRVARGEVQPLVLATAAAALGVVFGNPLVTGILVLESLVLAGEQVGRRELLLHRLLPLLAALGTGYVVRVGLGGWTGVPVPSLAIDGLEAYPSALVVDLLVGVPLALAVAALVIGATSGATWLRGHAGSRPLAALLTGALAVAALALAVRAATGEPVTMVLFSGQSDLGAAVRLTGVGALLAVAAAKALAYGLSLGAGFRGGTVFPAVFVGATLGAAAHALVPATSLPGLVAVGIAAGTGAVLALPFTAVLLAVLTLSPAGAAVTVPAVLGSVLAVVATTAAADRSARRRAAQSLVTGE